MTGVRFVGAVDGDPWGGVFAGTSRSVFTELQRRGALAGVVSTMPGWLRRVRQAGAFDPDMARWRQRYNANSGAASPLVRTAMSGLGQRRAAAVDTTPDVLLQLTHWADLRGRGLVPGLRASYTDAPTAGWRIWPDLAIGDQRAFRRTLDYEARVYRSMDVAFVKSRWARGVAVEAYGADPERVFAVGGGANIERMPPAPERDFGRPRILFMGRSFARKGGPVLLRAFRLVRQTHPEAEMLVAGPRRRPFGDEPGVRFVGYVTKSTPAGRGEFDRMLAEATVYAMPTGYDAFANPVLEAMAYRLPVVTSDTCAMPEIVVEGETGYRTPIGDHRAVAERINALIDDPDGARRMGEAGHRRMVADFTWEVVLDRIIREVSRRLGRPETRALSAVA